MMTERRNWDIRIGLWACAVAIAGLLSSLATGNRRSGAGLQLTAGMQGFLLLLAAAFLALVVGKMVVRNRRAKHRLRPADRLAIRTESPLQRRWRTER